MYYSLTKLMNDFVTLRLNIKQHGIKALPLDRQTNEGEELESDGII
jgi:hypothetical protein